jgi:K+-sensing histidine kinase KdpD
MSVAAAIRITSPDEKRVIEHAAAFAAQSGTLCFVITVVPELPYGTFTDEEQNVVERNLALIAANHAAPVMQEGHDIPQALLAAARGFGVRTLFVQSGESRLLGRSIAEQLLYLDPPFDVIVIGSE